MATDVKVTFSAEDEATEVARKLLETLRGLEREQKQLAQATAATATPAKQAADAFTKMGSALVGIKNTAGVDAISKRVTLLAQGLRSASTQAQSLAKLTAAESQLQKALKNTNLSLEQRIVLERTLKQTQAAIVGGGLDVPPGAVSRFQQLHAALLAIATAIGAIRLLGFAKDAIDAADALNDLRQRTGVSVESLSVLSQEAQKSGVSIDDVAVGFRQLSKTIQELGQGNADVVETFRAIGLSAKDLKGLSLDQVLIKIADALSKFDDGAGKSAVATRLLGRSGEALLPLLNSLANGGFANAAEKAKALGGVISGEAASAADQFNDSVVNLGTAISGFANELAGALTPLTSIVNTITEFLAKIPGGVKAFAAAAVIAGAAATALAAAIGALVIAFTALATVTGVGIIIGAITAISVAAGALAAHFHAAAEERNKLLGPLDKDPILEGLAASGALGRKSTITLQDPAQIKAARQAAATAAKQHERDLLGIEQAGLKQRQQIEDDAFAANLVGFEEHFQRRLDIARAGTAAEIKAIDSELATLRTAPFADNTAASRIQRESEINSLVEKRKQTAIEGETKVLALIAQQTAARKAAASELSALQSQLLRQQGEDLKASQLEIAEAANRFAETLTKQGFGAQIVADLRGAFSTLQTDIAAFQNQQKVAQQGLTQLALERAQIEQAAAQGLISERDAQLAIIALEKQRLPALQQAIDLMKAFADRVGDPALQQAAAQLQQQISGIGVAISESTRLIANFRDNLLSAAQSEFANFLGSTINNVKSLGDAFRQLGAAIASAFQRVVAEIIAAQLFEKIGSLFGIGINSGAAALAKAGVEVQKGGVAIAAGAAALLAAAAALNASQIVAGASAGLSALGGILGHARGGYVSGPGTGTSDSILARLSAGEYVIRASVVDKLGVPFLNALNALRTPKIRSLDSIGLPKFAEGGVVTISPSQATVSREDALHISVEHSEDTIVRLLKSSRGIRTLTEIMRGQSGQFRGALKLT